VVAVARDGAQVVATGSLRVSLRFLAYVAGVDLLSPVIDNHMVMKLPHDAGIQVRKKP
jgi:hypothetical protein